MTLKEFEKNPIYNYFKINNKLWAIPEGKWIHIVENNIDKIKSIKYIKWKNKTCYN